MEKVSETIINRVEKSGLITIDLLNFFPKTEIAELDIKPFLFQGLILKEKEFRENLSSFSWDKYKNKILAVFCSEDAIIPHWAYMLIAKHAFSFVEDIYYGTKKETENFYFHNNINNLKVEEYKNKRVILKGCNDDRLNDQVFMKLSFKLLPVVQSLMYGEACSNVPIYKKPKK